jgi:hypothetical protein
MYDVESDERNEENIFFNSLFSFNVSEAKEKLNNPRITAIIKNIFTEEKKSK